MKMSAINEAIRGVPDVDDARLREEQRRYAMSVSKTGVSIHRSAAAIEKGRLSNTGSKRSDESKAKMSAAQKGRTLSDETKRRMSESRTGMTKSEYKTLTCQHCGLVGTVNNVNRWHNDNCKQKPTMFSSLFDTP